jgi:hypothetical protein
MLIRSDQNCSTKVSDEFSKERCFVVYHWFRLLHGCRDFGISYMYFNLVSTISSLAV